MVDIQFFQQLNRAVHGLWRCFAALCAALLDASSLVGVESRVVIIQFCTLLEKTLLQDMIEHERERERKY